MLVLHIFALGDNYSSTAVIDLESRESPLPLLLVTQGDYDHYVKDLDMENTNGVKWECKKVRL